MVYFYDLASYQKMLRYPERVEAYTRALEKHITPESIVLELGTGFGYFALIAAKLGAKKVYAIEPNPIIRLGRELATANGLSEKIEFIEDYSTAINLPEKADICISDLSGTIPFYEHHIPTIMDARTRLLKADAQLIPQRDKVFVAAVESPKFYADLRLLQTESLNFSPLEQYSLNQYYSHRPKQDAVLSAGELLAELDYRQIESPTCLKELVLNIQRGGTMHGYSLWFERELSTSITYSTALDAPEHTYGNLFLPLLAPLHVKAGEALKLQLRLNYSENKQYLFTWQTNYQNISYQQSSFWGNLYHSDAVFGKK